MSVIVPARDEEACLGACLGSLESQTGVSFEIIVVDDASADRTREIAQSFLSVRVVEGGPPPPDWTGKNNAMAAGAKVARGEWLLFTDADTVHKPGSLARAVAEAKQRECASGVPPPSISEDRGSDGSLLQHSLNGFHAEETENIQKRKAVLLGERDV